MNIGHTLKSLRKMKSYTLKDLHEKTGLSVSYLSLLEQDKRSASFESLSKLSDAINVPMPVIVFLSASDDDLGDGDATLLKFQKNLEVLVKETELGYAI